VRPSLLLLLIVTISSVFAQGLDGIRSGFVYDSRDKSIRPVNGMPGAAFVGDALELNGLKFDAVEFNGTIAYAASSGAFYRVDLAKHHASVIEGILEGSKLVAPGLFWNPQRRLIQTETRKTFVDTQGSLVSATWNDTTGCAAVAFDTGNVESICGETQTTLFFEAGSRITTLVPLGKGFAALDTGRSRVIELGATSRVLPNADLADPVGLTKISESLLAVANATSQRLTFVALQGNTPDAIDLRFRPTTLRRLNGEILQLGEAGSDPFEVVDFAQQGRAFFVPTALSNASTRSEK
jgi:hypothetical protein